MADREEERKSFLMKVKEESEKPDLKLNIQKTKIIASGPIISWRTDGAKVANSGRLYISLASIITVDSDSSHETKRCLLLEIKAMTDLGSTLKSRDINLLQRSI